MCLVGGNNFRNVFVKSFWFVLNDETSRTNPLRIFSCAIDRVCFRIQKIDQISFQSFRIISLPTEDDFFSSPLSILPCFTVLLLLGTLRPRCDFHRQQLLGDDTTHGPRFGPPSGATPLTWPCVSLMVLAATTVVVKVPTVPSPRRRTKQREK